jgi:hypothetical protein
VASWLVAASFLVVIAGGGSLLVVQQKDSVVRDATSVPPRTIDVAPVPIRVPSLQTTDVASTEQPAGHALALGTGVETLTDNNLRQLMTDMDSFDALPASEPEPVINMDNADSSDQGTR